MGELQTWGKGKKTVLVNLSVAVSGGMIMRAKLERLLELKTVGSFTNEHPREQPRVSNT